MTRDGTRLSVDVYKPAEQGEYPVLITRTPYDNNRSNRAAATLLPSPSDRFKKLAACRFIVVACDVRGRGDSDGSFAPFAYEREDGADTVAWSRALSECNGRIGVFGSGYAGFTALAAATDGEVDAAAVWSPFGDPQTPFRGGALRLGWLFWMHLAGGRTPQPVDIPLWDQVFRHRPLITMDEALGRGDVPWREWLANAHARPLDVEGVVGSKTTPTLFVTGWWDTELEATVMQWEALGGAAAEASHALMIGPWDAEAVRHPRADVGGIDWGPSALVDVDELLINWFAAHLKGEGRARRGAQIFVTGRNEWTVLDSFASTTETSTLWLSSGGAANTRRGDGRLDSVVSRDAASDRFIHDPDNPIRWQPANSSFSRSALATFTLDTAFLTSRDEVLVYESAPSAAATLICGRAVVTVWVRSESPQADWLAAIENVFPGKNRSVHLAHGMVRVEGLADSPHEVRIELTPVAHELLPGHTLRVLLMSSLWPLYAVNIGGPDYLHDTEAHVAEHTLFHGAAFPSRIQIPLASGQALSVDLVAAVPPSWT